MDNENNYSFDLRALLKTGDLNVRQVAKVESTMTVGEYYSRLHNFLSLAPDAYGALSAFVKRDCNKNTCKCIDNTASLLTDLGHDRLIPDLYSIVDAYGKGDWRLASIHAKKISDDFYGLCTRVSDAKRKRKTGVSTDTPNDNNTDQMPLKLFIKHLDDEEADRKPIILAVDDSPYILKTVSSVLSGDYKVFTLAKPTMLEKMLSQITPDLFLLDYQMPELTGFELVPIIRGFEEHKDTPIIFLTSLGTVDNVSGSILLGACDFVVKPVRHDVLREKIAKHIVKKKTF